MGMDESHWPRCLLWLAWLPLLSGPNGGSLWVEDPAEGAGKLLECAPGSYTSGLHAECVPVEPDVWTDGCLVQDKVSGASSSGAGFVTLHTGQLWAHRRWGHLDDDIGGDRATRSCRGYCSVPCPSQTVQRAEFWEVILALQAAGAVHLGVDNLSVVRHVDRLLDSNFGPCPAELVKDGDLISIKNKMLDMRGRNTVRVSTVLGHADEGVVRDGRVRELDRIGNNAADEVADFDRCTVDFPVIDARRNVAGSVGGGIQLSGSASLFLIAISRAVVFHVDGAGTALDPLVWSAGALPKRRRLVHAVRVMLLVPGPAGIWDGEWIALAAAPITADDVGTCPHSVWIWVKWVAFLSSLHWPAARADLGVVWCVICRNAHFV